MPFGSHCRRQIQFWKLAFLKFTRGKTLRVLFVNWIDYSRENPKGLDFRQTPVQLSNPFPIP